MGMPLGSHEETCPHGRWSWQPCEKCIAAHGGSGAMVLLREIYDKGYLNVNEALRQRVLSCLFPPSQSDAGAVE
jgi:hypothetical protein